MEAQIADQLTMTTCDDHVEAHLQHLLAATILNILRSLAHVIKQCLAGCHPHEALYFAFDIFA